MAVLRTKCTNCGQSLPLGARKCESCGTDAPRRNRWSMVVFRILVFGFIGVAALGRILGRM